TGSKNIQYPLYLSYNIIYYSTHFSKFNIKYAQLLIFSGFKFFVYISVKIVYNSMKNYNMLFIYKENFYGTAKENG
ncbi:MAG: hypothetical protein J5894_01405, partial [Clostridia bacterium]|nr:hypothetical protein [Clostridia bacterium]